MLFVGCGDTDDAEPVNASTGAATTADITTTTAAPVAAPTTPPASTTDQATDASTSTLPPTQTGSPAATTEPVGPPLGSELIGRWAHYDVVAYVGDDIKTLIISYGFNDFTEVDGEIVDAAEFCFSEQRTDQPIETLLSDAATQAITPPTTPVLVDLYDGILRIRRPATPTPIGIALENPRGTPLPTDPNDPRIVDDDGDGKPGITVTIKVTDDLVGELYIARREIFSWTAFLVEPDRLEGTVVDASEQLVIGASDPIFATSGSDWIQFSDATKSPIILERVSPDWDCERLAAERDGLFPPTPDVDW